MLARQITRHRTRAVDERRQRTAYAGFNERLEGRNSVFSSGDDEAWIATEAGAVAKAWATQQEQNKDEEISKRKLPFLYIKISTKKSQPLHTILQIHGWRILMATRCTTVDFRVYRRQLVLHWLQHH